MHFPLPSEAAYQIQAVLDRLPLANDSVGNTILYFKYQFIGVFSV